MKSLNVSPPNGLLIVFCLLFTVLSSISLRADWIGSTGGSGANTPERNYNRVTNWSGNTINDTFSGNVVTSFSQIYFSDDRTTSGAVGLLQTGLGPFGTESLMVGADGLVLNYTSGAQSMQIQGGSTDGVTQAAHTLNLQGDVLYMTGVKGTAGTGTLTLGGAGTNGLIINLGSETRYFYSGFLGSSTPNAATDGRTIATSSDITGTGSLVKAGLGEMRIQAATSYTGATVVGWSANGTGGGNNSLRVRSAGTLSGSTDIYVLPFALLNLDNDSSSVAVTHLNTNANIYLNNGTIYHQYAPNAVTSKNYTETINSLNTVDALNVLNQGPTSNLAGNISEVEFNIVTLNRYNRSALLVLSKNTAAASSANPLIGQAGNNVFITNVNSDPIASALVGGGGAAGTSNQSILPFVFGTDVNNSSQANTFMTYDATNGLRPLDRASEYAYDINSAAADENVLLSPGATTLTTGKTVNALLFDQTSTGGALNLNGNTLTVTSGAVAAYNSAGSPVAVISNGTLAFGSREGILAGLSLRGITVSANITGSDGLTLQGGGLYTLSGNNSGLSGRITMGSGYGATSATLNVNHNNALGSGGNDLEVQSASTVVIGQEGAISARVASISGGSYLKPAIVKLNDANDSLTIGDGPSSVGTILLDGTTAVLSPGLSEGNDYAKVGRMDFQNGPMSLLNGVVKIDLWGAPQVNGSLAEATNDLILSQGIVSLSNGGALKLTINTLGGYVPAEGTSWTILVAGGASGIDTVLNANGGALFDSVTSGFTVSIGDYGTGTNNALILTVVPEPTTTVLVLVGMAGWLFLVMRSRGRLARA